jgi:sensor histidine kinase regulating citrate/malate metabolism
MPSKRRRVTLSIRQDSERTIFRVRDWGAGFGDVSDAEALQYGFTTKDGHAGAGLGLVAQLAAAAGGRLSVGRPAVGAIFTVDVPND